MKKHIVIVTSYYAPAWGYGGPPVVLSTISEELVKKDYKVSVITTDVLDEKRNKTLEEQINGVQIYRYPTISNTLAYRQKIFYVPCFLSKVKSIIISADCVLFSDLRTLLNWQLYTFLINKKIPYGVFSFGQIPYDTGWKYGIKRVFDALWVTDFVRNATWRFAQTTHEQKMYKTHFGIPKEKTHILYLPVAKKLESASKRDLEVMRERFNIFKTDKVVLYVGRLHYLKGIDILIQSILPLLSADKAIKLLIVGRDDGGEQRLRTMVPNNCSSQIKFLGPFYNRDVESVYKMSSCFAITPRFFEETSMATLEALSYGVPVVATREADVPHLEEYKAGFIVENKPEVIAQAIQRVIDWRVNDPHAVRKRTISLVKDKFFSSHIAKQLIVYLKNV